MSASLAGRWLSLSFAVFTKESRPDQFAKAERLSWKGMGPGTYGIVRRFHWLSPPFSAFNAAIRPASSRRWVLFPGSAGKDCGLQADEVVAGRPQQQRQQHAAAQREEKVAAVALLSSAAYLSTPPCILCVNSLSSRDMNRFIRGSFSPGRRSLLLNKGPDRLVRPRNWAMSSASET